MDASDIRGMDDLDNLIEAARCLGLVQARKAFGQYGPDDAASESGLHASISKRATRLRAEVDSLRADAERWRWISSQGWCPFSEADDAWDSPAALTIAVDEHIATDAARAAQGGEHG